MSRELTAAEDHQDSQDKMANLDNQVTMDVMADKVRQVLLELMEDLVWMGCVVKLDRKEMMVCDVVCVYVCVCVCVCVRTRKDIFINTYGGKPNTCSDMQKAMQNHWGARP